MQEMKGTHRRLCSHGRAFFPQPSLQKTQNCAGEGCATSSAAMRLAREARSSSKQKVEIEHQAHCIAARNTHKAHSTWAHSNGTPPTKRLQQYQTLTPAGTFS